RSQTPEASRTASLMHRLLMLKQQHPVAADSDKPGELDSSNGASVCVADTDVDAFERSAPQAGMPYGLPGLDAAEHGVLTRWLEQGARYEGPTPLPPAAARSVSEWERFFNGDSAKQRLFARYAYEHLFLAHLYFDEQAEPRYFNLVRSATPPGQPLRLIASRRPVDDPGVARVYYRLVEESETIVAKTHMPYALNAARMARWRQLFLDAPYTVDRLPGYTDATAANPFATFAAIPVQARYRFMLEEAEFTIMGFVKGPVCRGQIAVDVIEDRFWVTFLAPSDAYDQAMATLLANDDNLMRLPTGSSNTGILIPWLHYARLENEYLRARTSFDASMLRRPGARLDEHLIWDGDGRNDNAALTIFRHFDSASVVKGLVGDKPKTAWVIGYPLLERIHYLLVADYDVFGNVGHQLNSRLYMDFLRMEGEFNFLGFLPKSERLSTRDAWYRGAGQAAREQVYGGPATTLDVETSIPYHGSGDAKDQFLSILKTRLQPVMDTRLQLEGHTPPELLAPLQELQRVQGAALQWIPEASLLVVTGADDRPSTFTVLRDTGHASVSHLMEGEELRPEENTLTVVPGVVGVLRVRAANCLR
ncbi:MAG TPA: fatty acid cis/trans isomerase, partial [Burkholderiaceae bacterium]